MIMKKEALSEIKSLSKHLLAGFSGGFIKAIWIFGSCVRKKGNDIDIFVLYDDTQGNSKEKLALLESRISRINSLTKLPLHFQRPIGLGLFWSLLIKGEPWTITSLKDPLIIYDPSDFIPLIKRLLRMKRPLGEDIKAERLVARAEDLLTDNRELRVMLVEELFLAAKEAAQIFLASIGEVVFEPKRILKELRKYSNPEVYFQIMNLNQKASKGTLSEFTGEDLDYYTYKIREFIKSMGALAKELKAKKRR